jgi:uncharacterized membrane protein
MANLVKKFFTESDFREIADAIGRAEASTSGEIRVEIRQRRERSEKKLSIDEIARREFVRLGISKTRDRNGVLILILLEDHELEVLADESIHKKVDPEVWQRIADDLVGHFKEQRFKEGILRAVEEVGKVLELHYPRKADDTNELTNVVGVR